MDVVRGAIDIARATGALFAFEARQAARLVGMRLVVLVVALALVVSGVALGAAALALWLGSVVGATWIGFAIVGGAAIVIGGVVVVRTAGSLTSRQGLSRHGLGFEATREQLGRDLEWLDQQLGGEEKQSSSD